MKKWSVLIFLLLPFILNAQIITTVVGTSGGVVYDPGQLAFDVYGNLYCGCALCNKVLKIDTFGIITAFAGTGITGYSGDNGPATMATFNQPGAITTDTFGNVYITDNGNNRIRKVNISTGIITTIAGTGTPGYGGDNGPASSAILHSPAGLHFDKYGNLYVADFNNNRIRKIDVFGIITTIAGNGTLGSAGDGGSATAAICAPDYNMCTDALGNLFFIDQANYTIRKINTSGIISTIAGNSGSGIYSGDGVPALGANMTPGAIAFDKNGLLFISDYYNNRIRKIDNLGIIHTVTGDGTASSMGDGGPATSGQVNYPSGIAFDHCGNLYIAQVSEPRIRKIAFNPFCWPESLQNITTTHTINIYPNPANDILYIDNIKKQTSYRLLSIIGTVMQQGDLKEGSNSIPIHSLPAGMYIVEVTNNEGEKIIRKIIKQ